jgi:hypothetical protein
MLLLIGGISLAPFIGSMLLYLFWTPRSFTNYGELIAAVPLSDVAVRTRDGSTFRFGDLRGNWVFLMVDSGECDDYCQSKLYLMRQIRLTQGKDQERIQRVWLVPDAVRPPVGLHAQYQGTKEVLMASDNLLPRLPATGSPRDHVYLIDPFGNLMMRFPRNADPQAVKKDMNKLIRVSSGWVQTGRGGN